MLPNFVVNFDYVVSFNFVLSFVTLFEPLSPGEGGVTARDGGELRALIVKVREKNASLYSKIMWGELYFENH